MSRKRHAAPPRVSARARRCGANARPRRCYRSSAVDGAYLTDRSASLAKSIKDVEGELLQGQGARGRSDASLRARSRVAELRRALGATLAPLLAEAESAGLGNQLDGVRAELGRSEASVAFLERVVAADEAAASAGELARCGDVVGGQRAHQRCGHAEICEGVGGHVCLSGVRAVCARLTATRFVQR